MSDDGFMTSINPLFTAYELEIQVNSVTEMFRAQETLAEATLDDIQTQIQAISGSLSRLSDYLEELGNANRNVQNKFGNLVDAIEAKLGARDKADSTTGECHADTGGEKLQYNKDCTDSTKDQDGARNKNVDDSDDNDAISQDERERLQEHIPAIAEDEEARQARRYSERRAKMEQLRRDLSRLVRDTVKVTGAVQQTRDGVKVIGDSLKDGRKKPTKVIVDKPKPEKKRKVLENEKKPEEKQPNPPSKKSPSNKKPLENRNRAKKTKSADTQREKKSEPSTERPESETLPSTVEKTAEEIEQERLRLQFELEQALRQQKEQEQREETERRRLETEERQRREEEQRREQQREADPTTWNTLRYDVDASLQVFGAGLGCLVRVESDMEKDSMECSVSHVRADAGPLEERISDVISIKSRDGNPIHFKYPAVICIPYKHLSSGDPLVYVREGKGHWSSVPTETTVIDGVQVATFRRRRLKALRCAAVLARHGVGLTVDSEGGTLQVPEDPSVRIRVPSGSVTGTADLHLQVISRKIVAEALSRIQAKDIIDDVSAMSAVTLSKPGLGASFLETNIPSSNKLSTGKKNVYAMLSSDDISWSCLDPDYNSDPDKFTVSLEHERQSVLLLRTRGYVSKQDLLDTTRDLIAALKQFPACLVFAQKEADPHTIYIRCCRKTETDEIKSRLSEDGYHIDSHTSTELHLRDCTRLSMSFSAEGNIDFADDSTSTTVSTTFLSQAPSEPTEVDSHEHERRLKVKNAFCQRQHSVYRGKLVVFDTSPEEDAVSSGDDGPPSTSSSVVLCEIPVTLPKAKDPQSARSNNQPSSYFYGAEPLTENNVRQLANELGDDWAQLGHELGLGTAALQQVKQRHADAADRAFHVFRVWYMGSRKDGTKVSKLVEALHAVGRVYLAEELERKNQAIIEATKLRVKEQLFAKIAKRISADPRALDNWKGILRRLMLSDDVLAQIEGGATNRISCLQSGLAEWLRATPEKASPALLMHTLKRMGYHTAAEQVSFCMVK